MLSQAGKNHLCTSPRCKYKAYVEKPQAVIEGVTARDQNLLETVWQ